MAVVKIDDRWMWLDVGMDRGCGRRQEWTMDVAGIGIDHRWMWLW